MQIWHSQEADRPKSSNRIGFRNKDADRIAEALRREFDPDKRVELCHEFHALVHELQPYTFIYQRSRAVLYWDYLNTPEFSLVPPIATSGTSPSLPRTGRRPCCGYLLKRVVAPRADVLPHLARRLPRAQRGTGRPGASSEDPASSGDEPCEPSADNPFREQFHLDKPDPPEHAPVARRRTTSARSS